VTFDIVLFYDSPSLSMNLSTHGNPLVENQDLGQGPGYRTCGSPQTDGCTVQGLECPNSLPRKNCYEHCACASDCMQCGNINMKCPWEKTKFSLSQWREEYGGANNPETIDAVVSIKEV